LIRKEGERESQGGEQLRVCSEQRKELLDFGPEGGGKKGGGKAVSMSLSGPWKRKGKGGAE